MKLINKSNFFKINVLLKINCNLMTNLEIEYFFSYEVIVKDLKED